MAKGSRFSAFIIGTLLGAIGGLLYAPKSGKETREELKSRAEEMLEQSKESYTGQTDWVRKVAMDQADQLRNRIEATRERLKTSIEAAGTAAHESVNAATDLGEQAVDRAADIAKSATKVVVLEEEGPAEEAEVTPIESKPKRPKVVTEEPEPKEEE